MDKCHTPGGVDKEHKPGWLPLGHFLQKQGLNSIVKLNWELGLLSWSGHAGDSYLCPWLIEVPFEGPDNCNVGINLYCWKTEWLSPAIIGFQVGWLEITPRWSYLDYLGELTREMITDLLFTYSLRDVILQWKPSTLKNRYEICVYLELKWSMILFHSWKCSGPLKFMAVAVVEATLSEIVASQAKVESVQLLPQCLGECFNPSRKVNAET